jgi:hypothetical protein
MSEQTRQGYGGEVPLTRTRNGLCTGERVLMQRAMTISMTDGKYSANWCNKQDELCASSGDRFISCCGDAGRGIIA